MDLTLSARADTLWHEEHTATSDGDDHTFNGVMFNVACIDELPVDSIYLLSVSVRGELGDLSVYTKSGTYFASCESPEDWTRVYRGKHRPSHQDLVKLQFDSPIAIEARGVASLYIHSMKHWDGIGHGAIVYNNQRSRLTIESPVMAVSPALAHTSAEPFCGRGFWGSAWRPRREFVGAIEYAVRWKLWTPEHHPCFGARFRGTVWTLLMVHRYSTGSMARLSQDMLFYILNFLRHDSFDAEEEEAEEDEEGEDGELDQPRLLPPARARLKLATDRFGSTVVVNSDDEMVPAVGMWAADSDLEEYESEEDEDDL